MAPLGIHSRLKLHFQVDVGRPVFARAPRRLLFKDISSLSVLLIRGVELSQNLRLLLRLKWHLSREGEQAWSVSPRTCDLAQFPGRYRDRWHQLFEQQLSVPSTTAGGPKSCACRLMSARRLPGFCAWTNFASISAVSPARKLRDDLLRIVHRQTTLDPDPSRQNSAPAVHRQTKVIS
jgi:hypothetical protein